MCWKHTSHGCSGRNMQVLRYLCNHFNYAETNVNNAVCFRLVNSTSPLFFNALPFQALIRKTVTLWWRSWARLFRKSGSIVNWERLDDNNTLGGGQKPPKKRPCESRRELGVTLRQHGAGNCIGRKSEEEEGVLRLQPITASRLVPLTRNTQTTLNQKHL